LDDERDRARETMHSTALDAAVVAREAEVGLLALTHLSNRHFPRDAAREARTVFSGTIVPRGFDITELGFPERGGPVLLKCRGVVGGGWRGGGWTGESRGVPRRRLYPSRSTQRDEAGSGGARRGHHRGGRDPGDPSGGRDRLGAGGRRGAPSNLDRGCAAEGTRSRVVARGRAACDRGDDGP